jgi:DNA polymerase IV
MSTVSESLSELEVLVVDCQATGAPPNGHLLEIGWARAGPTTARADARLIALPHGEHIPAAVMRLTGISERMSQEGVDVHVAWRELSNEAAMLARQPAPTVIHFARFERPFLRALAGEALPLDILCTHDIARRLLPDLPAAACVPSRGRTVTRRVATRVCAVVGVMPATILHADLDAFYASVEQLLDPRLRGKPIAVGGGVVLAASYEARAFGVRSGMPGRRARQLCPDLVFVGGHFDEYQRLGDAAIGVLSDFTPAIERISIDEAFADVAGCTHLFGSPAEIARTVRARVRAELGLPMSIGVARTKHLAKIASQVAKPDGLIVVDPENELEFLHELPVALMWGVGPATEARLAKIGITTIGQLAQSSPQSVERLLGHAVGSKLTALAWNRDPRQIQTRRRAHSAGAQSALGRQPAIERVFKPTLHHLADRIGARLRAKSLAGRTITVRVRFADLRSVTRALTLSAPISATRALAEIAEDLVRAVLADHRDEKTISLLAIAVSHLEAHAFVQLELPLGLADEGRRPGTKKGLARSGADRAVDAIRKRFGGQAVDYGSGSRVGRSVPDEFRRLAEREL